MCGIIGILKKEESELSDNLVQSLIDLEYRGYDSAGIAIVHKSNIKIEKCLGAPSQYMDIDRFKKNIGEEKILTTVGIGHNRWATHGKPSISNAHPHLDCENSIAVVHNGTILNYESLKENLKNLGHDFKSDTDTEVVPHLIEEKMKSGLSLEDAIVETASLLEGSFGLAIIHKDYPKSLFVVKNGSPISIGIQNEMFIVASSTNAILRYTDRYLVLEDGEMAKLDAENMSHNIFKYKQPARSRVYKAEQVIEGILLEDLSKGDFDTFMQKEIFEQPATTRSTILGRTNTDEGLAVLGGLIDYKEKLRNIDNLYIVGCGTAYNAGMLGKELIESMTPINVSAQIASEFRYRKQNFSPDNSVFLSISQSGETADTLESLKEMKRKGFTTLGIVNVVGSAIAHESDAGIYTRAGTEIGVASTKAFTAQAITLYLFSLSLARVHGMSESAGISFVKELESIPEVMKKVLENHKEIERIASVFQDIDKIQFLGRGIHMPIAYECALKFKELTYMEAGSYPLGELKHGPMAVIDDMSLSVVILPKDDLFSIGSISIEQIKSKSGRLLVITDEEGAKSPVMRLADEIIVIPKLNNPLMYPLIEVLPLQLFAYYFANQMGNNIDKPRNLAKSVTVQ